MARQNYNRVGVERVTDEQIAAMAKTGVSDASTDLSVAERSGADDKVAAVVAENAPQRVSTFTPEARVWIEGNKELNTEGLYGQRSLLAIRPEDFQQRAQFLGRPLTVADLEEIHGVDTSAPASMDCTTCGKAVTSFIRTAMIGRDGDLRRNPDGNITYRGQAVTTGRPLAVHAAHTGTCLYKLRNNLEQTKKLTSGREVAKLLHSHSFEQANARLAGIQGHFNAKDQEKQAMKQRLGARTGGDAAGFSNGANFTPRTPRGKSRKESRNWNAE